MTREPNADKINTDAFPNLTAFVTLGSFCPSMVGLSDGLYGEILWKSKPFKTDHAAKERATRLSKRLACAIDI